MGEWEEHHHRHTKENTSDFLAQEHTHYYYIEKKTNETNKETEENTSDFLAHGPGNTHTTTTVLICLSLW